MATILKMIAAIALVPLFGLLDMVPLEATGRDGNGEPQGAGGWWEACAKGIIDQKLQEAFLTCPLQGCMAVYVEPKPAASLPAHLLLNLRPFHS